MYMVSLMRKGKAGPVEPAAAPACGPAWPVGKSFQPCVPTRPAWNSDLLLDAFQLAGGFLWRSNSAKSPAASSKRKSKRELIPANRLGGMVLYVS